MMVSGSKLAPHRGRHLGNSYNMAIVMAVLVLIGFFTNVEADRQELRKKRRSAVAHSIHPGSFVEDTVGAVSLDRGESMDGLEDQRGRGHHHHDSPGDHGQGDGVASELAELLQSRGDFGIDWPDTPPEQLLYGKTAEELDRLDADVKKYPEVAEQLDKNSQYAIKVSKTYSDGVKVVRAGVRGQREEAETLPKAVREDQEEQIAKIKGTLSESSVAHAQAVEKDEERKKVSSSSLAQDASGSADPWLGSNASVQQGSLDSKERANTKRMPKAVDKHAAGAGMIQVQEGYMHSSSLQPEYEHKRHADDVHAFGSISPDNMPQKEVSTLTFESAASAVRGDVIASSADTNHTIQMTLSGDD